jgi:hypothetical protein
MKLGVMQPYLFPYIGYFQLIKAVDVFVIYDDVQFIKGGWINRNRILFNGEWKFITLAVSRNESHDSRINERHFARGFEEQKVGIVRQLEAAYRRAPHFTETMELVYKCFECRDVNVSTFVSQTIQLCCSHLGIHTPLQMSSLIEDTTHFHGQDRIIWLNKIVGANQYVNAIGGKELYSKETFALNNLRLAFLRSQANEYPQFGKPFVPWLSIIDVLMFNSRESAQLLLTKFDME